MRLFRKTCLFLAIFSRKKAQVFMYLLLNQAAAVCCSIILMVLHTAVLLYTSIPNTIETGEGLFSKYFFGATLPCDNEKIKCQQVGSPVLPHYIHLFHKTLAIGLSLTFDY